MTVYLNISNRALGQSVRRGILLLIMQLAVVFGYSQQNIKAADRFTRDKGGHDLYGISNHFIENKGQYGHTVKGVEHMGPVLYGYEGLGMPVLFTGKGLIHLQRKPWSG